MPPRVPLSAGLQPLPKAIRLRSGWRLRPEELSPAEMLRRHSRREVTHCELFESIDALLAATREFLDRMNRAPLPILLHHRRASRITASNALRLRFRRLLNSTGPKRGFG